MGDRRSESSSKATTGKDVVGIKADVQTIKQLSSSAEAAQANRMKRGLQSLSGAVQDIKQKEAGGKDGREQENSGQGGRK